jgi:hypothetical protein
MSFTIVGVADHGTIVSVLTETITDGVAVCGQIHFDHRMFWHFHEAVGGDFTGRWVYDGETITKETE